MEYSINKKTDLSYKDTIDKIEEELKKEGFGILNNTDVKKTLKDKINVNYSNYFILGVCNPKFAYKALENQKDIGLFLPCNIVVYEDENKTIIKAINPEFSIGNLGNENLNQIAIEIKEKLKRVLNNI